MSKFTSEMIVPLKGADRVRKRPAVIFYSSDVEGALMVVANLIDNASREARKGYGESITIRRFEDNSFEVTDQGRGIPVEYNDEEKMYNWQLNFCELYAAGRNIFDNVSLNHFGLGLCSVQYVSEYMDAVIYREDKKYTLHFEKGENVGGLKTEENTENIKGTYLKFKIDETVFSDTLIKCESLKNLVKTYAVTNPGIKYNLEYMDADMSEKKTYLYHKLADRVRDCFPDEELILFEDKREFKGKQRERECSGFVNMCIAFTKDRKVEEVYHHERFLEHGGIALQELKNILREKINAFFSTKDVKVTKENLEKILNRISIIIHTKIYPRVLVSWESGARKAIVNPIIGENMRKLCAPLVDELLETNREEIIKMFE